VTVSLPLLETTTNHIKGKGDVTDIITDYTTDLDMKANIIAGLFSTDNFGGWSTPEYYCSSGNCTWADFSSLGICPKCASLSTKLDITCTPHANDLSNITGCDATLPNGFSLGGPSGSRTHLFAASTDYAPLIYGNYSNPLALIQTIASYNTFYVNSSTKIHAWECVLAPCVITYDYSEVFSSALDTQAGYNGSPYDEQVSDKPASPHIPLL
jgi:hypothetical protein